MLISGNAVLAGINIAPACRRMRPETAANQDQGRVERSCSPDGSKDAYSVASTRILVPAGILASSFGSPSKVPTTLTGLAGR